MDRRSASNHSMRLSRRPAFLRGLERLEHRAMLAGMPESGLQQMHLQPARDNDQPIQVANAILIDESCSISSRRNALVTNQSSPFQNTLAADSAGTATDAKLYDAVWSSPDWDWTCKEENDFADPVDTEKPAELPDNELNANGNVTTKAGESAPLPQGSLYQSAASQPASQAATSLQTPMILLMSSNTDNPIHGNVARAAVNSSATHEASENSFHYFSKENSGDSSHHSLADRSLAIGMFHDTFMAMSIMKPTSADSENRVASTGRQSAPQTSSPSVLVVGNLVNNQRQFATQPTTLDAVAVNLDLQNNEVLLNPFNGPFEQQVAEASQLAHAYAVVDRHLALSVPTALIATSRVEVQRPMQSLGLSLFTLTSLMLTLQHYGGGTSPSNPHDGSLSSPVCAAPAPPSKSVKRHS